MAATVNGSAIPRPHVKFISKRDFLAWAQHKGFPHRSAEGLVRAFKAKGGKTGPDANSPHRYLPIPVEQAMLFLDGYKIK